MLQADRVGVKVLLQYFKWHNNTVNKLNVLLGGKVSKYTARVAIEICIITFRFLARIFFYFFL